MASREGMMNSTDRHPDDERVLVLAPTVADAALTLTHLTEAGIACHICPNLETLCRQTEAGVGAILVTEELLTDSDSHGLVKVLHRQPPWSDVPVLLLTASGSDSPVAAWAMDLLGNVTVLERPVRLTSLISAVRTALRARRRQYELRGRMQILQTRGERLRLLWETAAVLLTTEQPETMIQDLFKRIAPHFGLDAYFNFMLDEGEQTLRMVSCMGIPDEEAEKITRLDFGQAICGTVALLRQPITATKIQESNDPKAQLVKQYGIRVYACNPLMAGNRLLGTLSFASRSRDTFDADDLEFLQTVCHYVAYAYERLRLIRQLREEDRKKDDFLATLAHELRNPLAPIRNAAQYLRLKGPVDPDLQYAQDIIERQLQQMTRLVDDLLDISRVTRGKIVLQQERLSLAMVLANAVEASRPAIEDAGHHFTMIVPPEILFVEGDGPRLAQVFSNLLNNAAKYTDRGGQIRVAAEREGSDVVVSVKDDGIGIAAEHLPRLFDMFSQVEPAHERSQGGLGIGLALVKSLVERHRGRVEVRSEGLGKGSEFIVRLPLVVDTTRNPPVSDRLHGGQDDAHLPKCCVLVADDNVDSARSLAMILKHKGHEVRTAHDGLAAVELAGELRPDVILLDIGMPKMNGYEAAGHIRGQPWGKHTLLVALTGWGQDDDKRRAENAGFDHHFTKPVNFAALQNVIAQVAVSKGKSRQS